MRGRPPHTIPPTRLEFNIPMDLRTKLDLHLFSPLEGKVPQGAYKNLICQLLKDYLDKLEGGVVK